MVKSKREIVIPLKRAPVSRQRILDKTITRRPNTGVSVATPATSTANIKVIVRVRPPNAREQGDNCRTVVNVIDDDELIFDPEEETQAFFFHGVQQKARDLLKKARKNMKFYFDKIYSPTSTNASVFEGTTMSLIDCIMDGYNCSVFAYGATGAGKTFTMTGTSENPGITFLTMTELFKKQEALAEERNFEIAITYLEVYNELVKDLLNPGQPLNLREDAKYGVLVAGLKFFKIANANELFKLLEQGNMNRTQHPTDANAESSRSHAVFQVYLKMTMKRSKEVRTAKLSMIDLAGSERGSATGFAGARFTEGANINKSLLALGNCINSLADGHRHVPYRDSKLTRLLKDSLGGNCQTVMIANISPSSLSYDDTYNTLKYATRASSIKANVCRNVAKADLSSNQYAKLVEDLGKEIQSLKNELQAEKLKNNMLDKENNRIKLEMDKKPTVVLAECDDESVLDTIKKLAEQKRELMERQFHLEQNESAAQVRRVMKEEIDNRLSDICTSTPEKENIRGKLTCTISRFRKQELALRGDIEKTEDVTYDVDKQFEELEKNHPQYKYIIESENLKLSLLRLEHRYLLEKHHADLLVEEHEMKTELIEKMSNTLRTCFKILKGLGYTTPSIANQYRDIVQSLQGKKNIRWVEQLDSGIGSMSSIQSEEDVKLLGKMVPQVPKLNETYSEPAVKETTKPKSKIGLQALVAAPPIRRLGTKSPKNKENFRKPLESAKTTLSARSPRIKKAKVTLSARPLPLSDRPRFRS